MIIYDYVQHYRTMLFFAGMYTYTHTHIHTYTHTHMYSVLHYVLCTMYIYTRNISTLPSTRALWNYVYGSRHCSKSAVSIN
jgi:hypothetical protein